MVDRPGFREQAGCEFTTDKATSYFFERRLVLPLRGRISNPAMNSKFQVQVGRPIRGSSRPCLVFPSVGSHFGLHLFAAVSALLSIRLL